jgi:hypothetical protein
MEKIKTLAGICCAIALAACGGGGGGGVDAPMPQLPLAGGAEGLWNATTSDQVNVLAAVLENGETWGLYTLTDGSIVGTLHGAVQTIAAENITISGNYYDVFRRTITPRSYSGKYSARDNVQLTASNNVKLTGTYNAAYESPAALSLPVGTYTGTAVVNQAPMFQTGVTVSVGGLISVGAVPGCTIRGVMTSRASGRNVFNVQLDFTGSTCPMKDGTVTKGIVLYNNQTQALVVMTLDGTKTESYTYVGSKV